MKVSRMFLKSRNKTNYESSVLSQPEKFTEQCKWRTCIYQTLQTRRLYLNILLLYLDNPSEAAVSESSQIKEQKEQNSGRDKIIRQKTVYIIQYTNMTNLKHFTSYMIKVHS